MSHRLGSKLREHYLAFGTFTYPGLYRQKLVDDLPDDIRQLGLLIRKNIIHRTTLAAGNVGTNADLRFGDMTKVPWWRQPEDDMLPTAAAMLAELYRRDDRGFVPDRAVENKLVLTCRFVAILVASILKSKSVPARVRSGNASYFDGHPEYGKVSWDHWINEYWHATEGRWVAIDVDGSLSLTGDFDPYDVPEGAFDFPAKAWLDIRSGKVDPNHFYNAGGDLGAPVVAWSLFYDFHSLMNNEIIYSHSPRLVKGDGLSRLDDKQLEEIDALAKLMLDPDAHFAELQHLWETKKTFRLLSGGLLD